MYTVPRLAALALLFLAAACLPACGSGQPAHMVEGKLVKDGQPYKAQIEGKDLPPGEGVGEVEVTFYKVQSDTEAIVNEDGEPKAIDQYSADVEADGTFELAGHKGKGIPPGKYRIVIKHIDPETEKDLLGGKFDERNSKITRDITGETEITINLDKPAG